MLGPPSVGRSILVYIAYLSPIDDDEILPHIHANTTGVAWVSKRTPYRRASVVQKRVVVQGQVGVVYLDGAGSMIFTHDATGHETAIAVVPPGVASA